MYKCIITELILPVVNSDNNKKKKTKTCNHKIH